MKTILTSLFLLSFVSGFAQISVSHFKKQVRFDTGPGSSSGPAMLASGDLDGDSKTDIVVPNSNGSTISIFINTHATDSFFDSTSFASKVDLTVLQGPIQTLIYDIDKDGKQDIIVAHFSADFVSVFPGTGTTGNVSFGSRIDYSAAATNPSYIWMQDLDGDSKAELITSNFGSGSVSVLLNKSTAGSIDFGSAVNFSASAGSAIVKTADMDGDTKPDILVTNYNDASFSVLKNTTSTPGMITFAGSVSISAGVGPEGIDVYDINKDGKLDVALVNSVGNSLYVYQNSSTALSISFLDPIPLPTATYPQTLIFEDMDGDTLKDIVITNKESHSVAIYRTKHTTDTIKASTFEPGIAFTVTGNPLSAIAADMDKNGSTDLIVSNNGSGEITVMVGKYLKPKDPDPVGVKEVVAARAHVTAYPNPFSNRLEVRISGNDPITGITLYDLSGRKVWTGSGPIANTAGLAAGPYMMEAKTAASVYYQKVFKQD